MVVLVSFVSAFRSCAYILRQSKRDQRGPAIHEVFRKHEKKRHPASKMGVAKIENMFQAFTGVEKGASPRALQWRRPKSGRNLHVKP